MKLILVIWRDAHGDAVGWTERSGLKKEARLIHTVGWWIEDAMEDHVSVAQSHDATTENVDFVIHIPTGMVVEWHWIVYED